MQVVLISIPFAGPDRDIGDVLARGYRFAVFGKVVISWANFVDAAFDTGSSCVRVRGNFDND